MPRYLLTAPQPSTHRLHVEARFAKGGTFVFPSWAPGSYLQREFARNSRDISARSLDGTPVPVVRLSRNEWLVESLGPVVVDYAVYCREKSVRTPYVGDDLWFFLPSNILIYDPAEPAAGFDVEFDVPAGFTAICPLGAEHVFGPGERARFHAQTVDELMDAPISAGPFQHTTFEVSGVPHHHWIEPGHNGAIDRMNADLKRIVEAARDTVAAPPPLPPLPYRYYHFITLHMARGHGGLEHNDCCVLLRPRLGFKDPKGYEEFLTLAAHEHFHAWNVKRIRPAGLGPPFDYRREHYIRDLWWLEGGTVYYEERIAYRAGLVSRERHLERMADLVKELRSQPGRLHQSLEDSSFDAWIKLYRQGEDSKNSTISYYLKGAVVVWAMDLELLSITNGKHGVDDVLRHLWTTWGCRDVGFPDRDALLESAAAIAGDAPGWARWWDLHVKGTGEVEIEAACAKAGFTLVWTGGGSPWLGVETGNAERVTLSGVREDGPSAGQLSPGDEILALNGDRVLAGELGDRVKQLPVDQAARILISRDGRILERSVRIGTTPAQELKIERLPAMSHQQSTVQAAWLSIQSPARSP